MSARPVLGIYPSHPTSDGAGVRLRRSIGGPDVDMLDPFLLLDAIASQEGSDYIAGFPDHPHRGFETVTYMLNGRMRHRDSTGAQGVLESGGAQWMTAGRGIVHSEMPEQQDGLLQGFQLWVNLPAAQKMRAPRYQDIAPDQIPEVTLPGGGMARIVAGSAFEVTGPVEGIVTEPLFADIRLGVDEAFSAPVPEGHTVFAYVYDGAVVADGQQAAVHDLVVFGPGPTVALCGGAGDGGRFLLLAARPIGEPVARYGPFVMNTKEEVLQAFRDFDAGRF